MYRLIAIIASLLTLAGCTQDSNPNAPARTPSDASTDTLGDTGVRRDLSSLQTDAVAPRVTLDRATKQRIRSCETPRVNGGRGKLCKRFITLTAGSYEVPPCAYLSCPDKRTQAGLSDDDCMLRPVRFDGNTWAVCACNSSDDWINSCES